MSIRESIRERPAVAIGLAVALFAICGAVIWFQSQSDSAIHLESSRAFFTTDDGKTWFPEDATKSPPIMVNGKEAVRCYVYTCDKEKTKFAAYLERFQSTAKARTAGESAPFDPMAGVAGAEVKRPGETTWIARTDPRALAVMEPKCPSGSGTPVPVYPE